jgi:transcriptional regulator with XRE-family HTH domain
MDVLRRIGLNLTKYRERLELSQEQFAFECDLDRTYISGIERGRRNVGARNLQKIADALGVAPGKLFEAVDDPARPRGRGRPAKRKSKRSA